jgi:hypothetical protein
LRRWRAHVPAYFHSTAAAFAAALQPPRELTAPRAHSGSMLDPAANVAISAIGSANILLAYILVSFRSELGSWGVAPEGAPYQVINLIGGAFACAGAFATENPGSYPLGVLEGIWAAIAAAALVRIAWRRRSGGGGGGVSDKAAGGGGGGGGDAAAPGGGVVGGGLHRADGRQPLDDAAA